VKVAVAVIFDEKQQVLITQRPLHATHGGKWEFPGGKLEAGELASSALIREIKEEIGIDIVNYYFLDEIVHDYGAKTVSLQIFIVNQYQGEASCCESQLALCWVSVDKLKSYDFPEANTAIIELIKPLLPLKQ